MTKITPWKTTNKRFVIFIDIMGFKELVLRNTHKYIYDLLSEISEIRNIIETANTDETIQKEFKDAEIYSVSFSDSIILFSATDSIECFDIITYAASWLFAKAIEKNIPLKGAMAYGEMSVNKTNQIYFGQPLIDAYLLEEDLHYYGIVAHHTLVDFIQNNHSKIKTEPYLFETSTPLKGGYVSHTNINWTLDLTDESKKDCHEIFNEKMKKFSSKVSGPPGKYLDNTKLVFDKILSAEK